MRMRRPLLLSALLACACLTAELDENDPTGVIGDGDGDGDGVGSSHDGVQCENDLCVLPDVCCAAMDGSSCAEECVGDEVAIACDGPEDCSDDHCCWGLTVGASCAPTGAACSGTAPEIACNLDSDCPDGQTCMAHEFIDWIWICQ